VHTALRLTTLTATTALTAALAAPPVSAHTGGGANNLVQVVNTTDSTFAHRAGVQAAPYGGDSAQSTNLARSDSRDCAGCRTHSAALQAVFLTGDPSSVQVANAAVATNSDCTSCLTYAYAYQYVVTAERAVSLSPSGHQQLQDLQARANAVIAQTVDDFDALTAQLDVLADELDAIVDRELQGGGHKATTSVRRDIRVATN
jgi:putative peptide zinc metalloprotease protein